MLTETVAGENAEDRSQQISTESTLVKSVVIKISPPADEEAILLPVK